MKIEELKTSDIELYLKTKKQVIIPFGSIEQHGNHLPLGTDSYLVDTVAEKVSDGLNIIKLPLIYYGPCFNSISHAGTISVATTCLFQYAQAIVLSLYRQGFRVFFLFSGHAEQSQLMTLRELAEDMIQNYDDSSFHLLCTYQINKKIAQSLFDCSNEFHAGAIETSLMLYLKSDLVDRQQLYSGKKEFPEFKIIRDKKKFWPSGVYGNPGMASEDLGFQIFNKTVEYIRNYIGKNLE